MQIGSLLAIYFVLWWIVLFAVLPFGVKSQTEAGESVPGSELGAPVAPQMLRKLVWTTIVSAIIFAISVWCYKMGYFNLDRLNRALGIPL